MLSLVPGLMYREIKKSISLVMSHDNVGQKIHCALSLELDHILEIETKLLKLIIRTDKLITQ